MNTSAAITVALLSATVSATNGVTLTRDTPDLDRWNYPFNPTPGVSETAVTFAVIGIPDFDNHDSQFLLGFNTSSEPARGVNSIPSGLGDSRYEIVSARVTATIATGNVFVADSTFDEWTSYLPPEDPEFTGDLDPGRPITLFGTGYRNGFGIEAGEQEYIENTPFAPGPPGPPMPRIRSAFASDYNNQSPRDISNNIADRFEVVPFAIGQLSTTAGPVSDGDMVPAEATVTFDANLANPDVVAYFQKALDAGNLQLSITSLHFAAGGPGGGKGVTYPVYFTKEDPLAPILGQTATLELEVNILPAVSADLNNDGSVDSGDLAILLAAWGPNPGSPADLNNDNTVDSADLAILLAAWG